MEEEMKYSNMNKWAAMRMRVLQCNENDVKKQQSQVQAVSIKILINQVAYYHMNTDTIIRMTKSSEKCIAGSKISYSHR